MPHFTPCIGRTACREDEVRCLACGRTLQEIAAARTVTDSVTTFLQQMNYDNPEAFLAYLQSKVLKKLSARGN